MGGGEIMTEDQYQLGIRKMSTSELVALVTVYRNLLKDYTELCEAFYKHDFAKDQIHKVTCAVKAERLKKYIEDYKWALQGER